MSHALAPALALAAPAALPDALPPDLAIAARLAVATLAGLAVGVEREWSGGREGAVGRFAGVRTFALYGLAGGLAGLLLGAGAPIAAGTLLVGATGIVVAAYLAASRAPPAARDPGATTEIAALVVLGLGVLAGLGRLGVAGGGAALVALALGEKARLHWLVRRLGERELRAGLQFAVLALVVLPLLPVGPYGPAGAVRPRALWATVLVFLALDFAGWVARRAVGASRGYGVTGVLGGLVSSTAVTLGFSRRSRAEPAFGAPLALGVVGACTVLLPRVAAVSAALAPAVTRALVPYLAPPVLVGVALGALALRRRPATPGADAGGDDGASPLRLWPAVQMAVAFQLALLAVPVLRGWFGAAGVLASAAVLGLTDVDALTVSMSRLGEAPGAVPLAARAIAVGILANTLLKLGLVLALGEARFRRAAGAGLAALAAASALGVWIGGRVG